MSGRITNAGRLGWAGDGEYRYDPVDRRGNAWPSMPLRWMHIADAAAGTTYAWDSAIINWYDENASLGWHQDKNERDRSLPIVTISLGDAASWAIRKTMDDRPTRTRIGSGAPKVGFG